MPPRKPKTLDGRKLQQEFVRRFGEYQHLTTKEAKVNPRTFRFMEALFPQQRALLDDPSPLKAAVCSRRAGKSTAAAYYMIRECLLYPHSVVAYIALTRTSARRILWSLLKQANRAYALGAKFYNTNLECVFPNGSQIILTGASDEGDIDRLRGLSYRLVVLDEAGSFAGHIVELVEEVIEPGLVDVQGSLLLIGTPTASCSGLFHEATTGIRPDWSVHHWTILENPYVPGAQSWLDNRMKLRGWDENNPIYLREWRGKWVRSDDSLIYRYTEDNLIDELPEGVELEHILAVDLGWHDATSFATIGFNRNRPEVYVVDCWKQSKMLPSDIAETIHQLNQEYNYVQMVMDTAGTGKSLAEEFKQRKGLPIKAAEKKRKNAFIELLQDDLRTGRLKIKRNCEQLLSEYDLLQWHETRMKEDDRFENHCADSVLYAWREAKHWCYEPLTRLPEPGTPEFEQYQMDQYWEAKRDELAGKENAPWFENTIRLN